MTNCPVPYTCSAIDRAIVESETARNYIDQGVSALEELLGRNGYLEELRDQNSKLRAWGESLLDKIEEITEEYESEIQELQSRISYLEEKYT